MPPATLSRFQIVLLLALSLGGLALWLHNAVLFGAVVLVFLTITGVGIFLPHWSLFGPYVCRGAEARRCVALTFDDGPDSSSTPALLDLLREANVPAAFF